MNLSFINHKKSLFLVTFYFFAIIWLMLGFIGILELFGFGSIANFAHLGGLIGGIIYATILNIVNLKT